LDNAKRSGKNAITLGDKQKTKKTVLDNQKLSAVDYET
jgi:hypothetical protein